MGNLNGDVLTVLVEVSVGVADVEVVRLHRLRQQICVGIHFRPSVVLDATPRPLVWIRYVFPKISNGIESTPDPAGVDGGFVGVGARCALNGEESGNGGIVDTARDVDDAFVGRAWADDSIDRRFDGVDR